MNLKNVLKKISHKTNQQFLGGFDIRNTITKKNVVSYNVIQNITLGPCEDANKSCIIKIILSAFFSHSNFPCQNT